MTSRERVNLALAHEEADRVPRAESFWPETIPSWWDQGLSRDADLAEMFGYDIIGAGWANHEAHIGFQEVVAEDAESITRKDGHGAVLRYWKHKSGTPEHVAFSVDTPDKWSAHKRELLTVPPSCRVDTGSTLRAMYEARVRGKWFCWGGVECFEMVKDVLGHETICCAMADNPEWVKEVFDTYAEIAVSVLDHLEASGVTFDGAWVYGDIAYNHAPFCSPAMYRRLVMPAHQRHIGWFKQRGLKVIYHTDGDFRPLIPSFLEAGIDCFQPLEAKAGMDVRELKPLYGDRVSFMGNIDATVLLTNDPARIEAEVAAKVPVAKAGGGYIYHSDHSIPPGVTWGTYRHLMALLDAYGRY